MMCRTIAFCVAPHRGERDTGSGRWSQVGTRAAFRPLCVRCVLGQTNGVSNEKTLDRNAGGFLLRYANRLHPLISGEHFVGVVRITATVPRLQELLRIAANRLTLGF